MHQLQNTMQKTQGIHYYSNTLQEQFQKAYPGYQVPNDFQKHYQTNVNTAQQTFCGVLESLRLQAQHVQAENQHLDFLQHQVQHAQGQTQAIQASSQITSEIVSQQQLLRQAVMAQTNAQTAYYATQLQNDASRHAAFVSVIQAGATNIPAYGSSGQTIKFTGFLREHYGQHYHRRQQLHPFIQWLYQHLFTMGKRIIFFITVDSNRVDDLVVCV